MQYKQQCKRKYRFKKSSLQVVTETKKHRLKDRNKTEIRLPAEWREDATSKKSKNRKQKKTKAMKTKNNVQKAILRWSAVVVSFVLISFTVSAQDFWERLLENSSFDDIAMAMVEVPVEAETSVAELKNQGLEYLENETEPEMELEAWMMNEDVFWGEDDKD